MTSNEHAAGQDTQTDLIDPADAGFDDSIPQLSPGQKTALLQALGSMTITIVAQDTQVESDESEEWEYEDIFYNIVRPKSALLERPAFPRHEHVQGGTARTGRKRSYSAANLDQTDEEEYIQPEAPTVDQLETPDTSDIEMIDFCDCCDQK